MQLYREHAIGEISVGQERIGEKDHLHQSGRQGLAGEGRYNLIQCTYRSCASSVR